MQMLRFLLPSGGGETGRGQQKRRAGQKDAKERHARELQRPLHEEKELVATGRVVSSQMMAFGGVSHIVGLELDMEEDLTHSAATWMRKKDMASGR